MDGRDRHVPGPGAGQRLLPGGPGRRPRAGAGPLARPRPLPGRRRPPRPAAGLQRGDAPARRLRLRQPRAGRPRRHRPRAGRGPARVPPSRPGRRRPARPGRPGAAGAGHPRPHPRAPGLPAGRRRPTAGAVLRRVAAGRRRGPHRPDQPRPHPTAGQGAVALAAPAGPDAARRPGRLPHPRGRVVLLRPHRHRANHHHRPREGHQSAAGRPRRGHLRQAAGGRARLLPPLLPTAARDQPPRPPHLGRHPAAAGPPGPTAGAPPGRRGRRAGRRTTDRRLRRRARPRRAVDPAAPLVRHLAGLAGARRPPAAGRAGARPGPRRPGPPGPQGRLRAAGRRAGRRDGRLALRRPARGPHPPGRSGRCRGPAAGTTTVTNADGGRPVRLGLRANLAQFLLLVGVNALVGGMVGQERTVVPLLATRTFHLQAFSAALSFIVVFGATKALTNLFAGTLSDRLGRKPVLVAGWLVGLPVPLLVIWAPSWGWVVAANVLLGINQGLTWSTTVIMKIDLAGPKRRGLAMGLNEAAGYGAVAATALATGFIAQHAGLRPEPFFLGIGYAGLGLGLSALLVRETRAFAEHEAATHVNTSAAAHQGLSTRQVFLLTSFRERALSACSQAGLVNNLNDGLAWGIFPLFFASTACRSAASASWPRCTRPSGELGSLSPAPCRTGWAANGSSPAACGPRPWRSGWSRPAVALGPGPPGRCCWALAPPWSTPPCWPPSAMSPIPAGGPPRSGSTGCGATAASPSARCSPASWPTCWAWPPPSERSRPSRPPPAWSSPCACTRPTAAPQPPQAAKPSGPSRHPAAEETMTVRDELQARALFDQLWHGQPSGGGPAPPVPEPSPCAAATIGCCAPPGSRTASS